MIDAGTLAQWAAFIVASISLGYAIVGNKSKAANARAAAVEIRVDKIEDRLTKVEGDIEHLPDKESTHRMEMSIARLEGQLEVMTERLRPVASIAERLQEFMLEQAKHK